MEQQTCARFSVVIPWRDRPELKKTLTANAELFARHAVEVVIVNCGGDVDELAGILSEQSLPIARHILLPGATFNRSLAKNVGILCSSGRYLFFLDADIELVSDPFEAAHRKLEREDAFVYIRTLYESRPQPDPELAYLRETIYIQRMQLNDGRVVRIKTRRGSDGSACAPGLLALRREHVLEVRGFNSALVDWGFEDFDMHIRLQVAAKLTPRWAGAACHLTHGNERREVSGVTVKEGSRRNKLKCVENYSRGVFLGTYDEDAVVWRDTLCEISSALQERS
jgi:glycosyltransferase involved in cell wall biosynthesis